MLPVYVETSRFSRPPSRPIFLSLFCVAGLALLFAIPTRRSDFPSTLDIPSKSLVAFEGDSIIYGQDETDGARRPAINGATQGRSTTPLPELLSELLEHRIDIENRGFPGDRTIDGLQRWRNASKIALVFIMYGTNDAMNFGDRPGGIVSIADYAANLKELVNRRRLEGTKVVLMTPPPIGVPRWDAKTSPYRAAAKRVAAELGVPILNTSEVLSGIVDKWADGLHLSKHALEALAHFLANHIRLTESKELSNAT
jgi:lysophospholipase L1-like esterase